MYSGQLTWEERGWLWLRLAIRLVLIFLLIWMLTRFGETLLSLLAPFGAALCAAVLLNPVIRHLRNQHKAHPQSLSRG